MNVNVKIREMGRRDPTTVIWEAGVLADDNFWVGDYSAVCFRGYKEYTNAKRTKSGRVCLKRLNSNNESKVRTVESSQLMMLIPITD